MTNVENIMKHVFSYIFGLFLWISLVFMTGTAYADTDTAKVAHNDTLSLTDKITMEIPGDMVALVPKANNCVYVGQNADSWVSVYVIPRKFVENGQKMKLTSYYDDLENQDSLHFNLSDLELLSTETDKWYHWRNDYVKRKYVYSDEKIQRAFCTFSSHTYKHIILVAIDAPDSVASQHLEEMLKTMDYKQGFFRRMFRPADETWPYTVFRYGSVVLLLILLKFCREKIGWIVAYVLLCCGWMFFAMEGDWIGVLVYLAFVIVMGIIFWLAFNTDSDSDVDLPDIDFGFD